MIQVACDPKADGPTNMAKDALLLSGAEEGRIGARVYFWDGPWVSLGRSQNPERDLLPGNAVPYVARPTGGQAVLHGHDATIGLAIPTGLILGTEPKSVKAAYRGATRPILKALNACGLNVALAADTEWIKERRGLPDCFAATSEMDIVDTATGLKICGCAMRRKREAVLLQASIPMGQPLVDPETVFSNASSYVGPDWDPTPLADELASALSQLALSIR